MAHHKDAIKRIKQSEKANERNRTSRSRMRNQIKRVREAIARKDEKTAQVELRAAVSVIHRTAGKGVIHRNQAARRISRLNRAVKALVVR
ncbi:MAG: 30S ribosomal protein S20 [Deltaproteobacteria bacterium]|nr:30S ribosomal protein S20 [Deltaproteobacteria bacterium]